MVQTLQVSKGQAGRNHNEAVSVNEARLGLRLGSRSHLCTCPRLTVTPLKTSLKALNLVR